MGDYLGAAVDPLHPECVWLGGQYASGAQQGENWGTHIRMSSYSGACDSDNDGTVDATDRDDDNDRVFDLDEPPCGSDPLNATNIPERVDGTFDNVDDDGDAEVDEPLPGGAGDYDCDGDGFAGVEENWVFGVTTGTAKDQDTCGTTTWPPDLSAVSDPPNSLNKINLRDLQLFTLPQRRLDTSPGDPAYDVRWDLVPGRGNPPIFAKQINISDMQRMTFVVPPMLGTRAFNGPTCPWPP